MTNPHKGEVSFDVDGTSYTLRFSIDALIAVEDAFDMPFAEVGAMLEGAGRRIRPVRALFWHGLRDRHPEITEAQAGELLTRLTLNAGLELVVRAVRAAFGISDDAAEAASRPPVETPAGTG